MKLLQYITIFIFVGCNTEEPCTVEQSAQTGDYTIVTTEQEGGDCGSMGTLDVTIEDGIVQLDDGLGCELVDDDWHVAECTTSSLFHCDDGTWKMELTWHLSSSNESDVITGILESHMDKWDGLYICDSTYTIEATK